MRKIKIKKNKILLAILLLAITIGYALLSTNINIVGSSKFMDAKWDIHLDNLRIVDGSVEALNGALIDNQKTSVNYNVVLTKPGDFYEFLVDVVNTGTIDGMIDIVSSKMILDNGEVVDILPTNLPRYLNYKVTYQNQKEIQPKQELKVGEKQTYRVRLEYKKDIDISDLPTTEKNIQFIFSINYIQKDSTSIAVPTLQVGDYVSMTPDKDIYSISKEATGYDESQQIEPKELNLWRVISVNEDGTFDAVSEYVSSKDVVFKGITGYSKIVSTLQNIASSYMKNGYTTKARNFGFDGQHMVLSDLSTFDGSINQCPITNSTPIITSGAGKEFNNGVYGDTMYIKDYSLIKKAYNNSPIKAYRINKKGQTASYWKTSRSFESTATGCNFGGSSISRDGLPANDSVFRSYKDSWSDNEKGHAIRPIITLKTGLNIDSGDGTSSNPFVFS